MKFKIQNANFKIFALLMACFLFLTPSALAISDRDFNALVNDTVFYEPDDLGGPVSGLGGCVSPLLPSINDQQKFADAINAYIKKLRPDSPLAGLGADFVKAGIQYGVNPAWVVNIARKESSFGVFVPKNSYNSFGRTASSSQPAVLVGGRRWYRYDSWQQSLYGQSQYLKERYFDQGLTDFTAITNVYAPASENDTATYIKQMEQWVNEVTNLAGIALDCGQAGEGL